MIKRALITAALALTASPAAAQMESGLVMPGLSTGPAVESYLRFSNSDGAAHSASVMLHDANTGEMLATWTSPSIPAGGTLESSIAGILSTSEPRLSQTALSPTLVVSISGLVGHVQHAAKIAASGTWTNLTSCGMLMMADPLSLPFVSGPGRTDLVGFVRITNGAASALALDITFTDNAGGASLWRSPTVPAMGSVVVAMTTIAQQAAPAISVNATSLVATAGSAPGGVSLSYLEALAGSTSFGDFSGACMLAISGPVTPSSSGSTGGGAPAMPDGHGNMVMPPSTNAGTNSNMNSGAGMGMGPDGMMDSMGMGTGMSAPSKAAKAR